MNQKKWKTSEKPVELASGTFRPSLGSASTNYVPYLSAAYRNTLPPLVSETLARCVPCPITCPITRRALLRAALPPPV